MEKHYGWVVVAAGALITCLAMGAMFALPVYLQPMAEATGWSLIGHRQPWMGEFLASGQVGRR